MSTIVYIICPKCVILPRPNCHICSGLNGTYINKEEITPHEKDLNINHIYTIHSQYKKASANQFWPNKLRTYFSDSIIFLEQFNDIDIAQTLTIKIKRTLKYQLLREIRSTLIQLKSHPNIEYIESLGFEINIRGNRISYLNHPDVLRIILFSVPHPILKPKLKVIEAKINLMNASIYNLSFKNKLAFTDPTKNLEAITPDLLAVVKISYNTTAEYYYLNKNDFDAILNAT